MPTSTEATTSTQTIHPVADIFPRMAEDEFGDLVNDILNHGLREPIWLHPDGRIIDGRNRYAACEQAGIEPEYRTWDGEGSLVEFVVSLNLHRRHLSSSQRAVVSLDMLPHLEAEAKERQREGGRTKVVQQIEQPRSVEQAAKLTGTNRQYVSDAKKLASESPAKLEEVRAGKKTITQVKREIREEKREQRRDDNRAKVARVVTPDKTTDAKFATILIDPPWDWGDEGDVNQLGRAKPDYSTMSLAELEALPVPKLADDDCHLYLWITNRSLPKGFRLIESWGFRYITALTWCKPSFGMGNYFRGSTEHILFAVKGSQPLKRKDAGTWFEAERGKGGHSSKPTAAYELVESCSPGPYLEMFSRRDRSDWTAWGENAA